MKSFDVIVMGAGMIGVSLARELRKRGLHVLVLDRGAPGHEASQAGAGMLAAQEVEPELRALARASAEMYPEFVREIEAESGLSVDFRRHGTLVVREETDSGAENATGLPLTPRELADFEPALAESSFTFSYIQEDCVDPRTLFPALVESAKRLGVEIHAGNAVTAIAIENNRAIGVQTSHAAYSAGCVINCCGAWSGELKEVYLPTRPVKGHMLEVVPKRPGFISRVIRSHDVYLVPRSNGCLVIGSTVEEAGYDKRVDPDVIQHLHQLAANLIPEIGEALIHKSWTGLRPGTPDGLPIMGPTSLDGYFAATGHYRNGILLAPVTARLMADVVSGCAALLDIEPFLPSRFLQI